MDSLDKTALYAVLRPFVCLLLWVLVIYWIKLARFKLLPPER